MKINNNISAVITNKHLLRTEKSLSFSMERLSSGFKLNHSWDNPSGVAISNKMNAQIDGLDRASSNASDGMSVLDTADGAMNEITLMIQRMRELSVQAANDTNTQDDKQAIQDEIDSLTQEIDRVSSSTEFNTKSLLDGSLDNRVYTEHVTRPQISSTVEEGNYKFKIDAAAKQAEAEIPSGIPDTIQHDGRMEINGYPIELKKGMSKDDVYEKIRQGAEIGGCTISDDPNATPLKVTSMEYGVEAKTYISFNNKDLASEFGMDAAGVKSQGEDASVTLDKSSSSQFKDHTQATVSMEGNKMVITDNEGFEISFMAEAGYTGDIDLEVTDIGPMDLQIGANEGQRIAVKIPAMDTKSLYIDDIDVRKMGGADKAIAKYDAALDKISQTRANIGAYSNRLDHSVAALDTTHENVTSAITRLKDVDMAEEMTEFTKYNVLQQAGTSALSQANEIPQMALQLLG
ncbi:MAG: flagellin [Lachnospiraceae bacterium]|nr:flagellin [Lachnospiraceae bacterium]